MPQSVGSVAVVFICSGSYSYHAWKGLRDTVVETKRVAERGLVR